MSNELAPVNNENLCAFDAETLEDKKVLYNAINSPDYRVADMINKPINIRYAMTMPVTIVDDETGEMKELQRSIIIDTNGKSYSAVSAGIASSIRNVYSIFGTLNFPDGIQVVVKQSKTKRGSTLSLTM